MGILSLVLGILSLVVFDWLGMTIGSGMVGAATLKAAMTGSFEVSTGPIWGFGLGLGVFVPLIAVAAGAFAIKSKKKKGLGISGLVMGIVAAVIGGVLTFGAASAVDAAAELGKSQIGDAMQGMDSSISDKELEDALKKGIEEAMQDGQ